MNPLRAILIIFLTLASNVISQNLSINGLEELVGGENLGLLAKVIPYNNLHYLETRPPKSLSFQWHVYSYNQQPREIAYAGLPQAVKIQAREDYAKGTKYLGKYYYPHENKIHVYDSKTTRNKILDVAYPEGFKHLNDFIIFNNKLFFTAFSDKWGNELFSYLPGEGIQLVKEVANGYRIGRGTGKKYAISSSPECLFTWKNYLIYSAKDGWNKKTYHYGRELYKLDADGNVTLLKDICPGSTGADYYYFDFFEGRDVIYSYRGRKFYELTADGKIIPFHLKDVSKYKYEIKSFDVSDNYLFLHARTQFPDDDDINSPVHLVVIEKNGTVHKFPEIQSNWGVFFNDYYIFNGEVNYKTGEEPYILNLKTWTISLLKNIRTEPYIGLLGPDYGSEPSMFYSTGKEVFFTAQTTNELNSWKVFSIRDKNPLVIHPIEKDNIQLYPNPVHKTTPLHIASNELITRIEMYDISGKAYFLNQVRFKEKEYQFDLSDIPAGIYMVRIHSLSNIITKKLVVVS
ncbi:T9SS C-terminal target domain-containing protein [Marinilabiliaceae bacterium JC017]|nr:T9SS C-terminal target domain-containing protein [Marinilabiliaceae bacterium JC017]